ncbi:hypothetical protein AAEX37_00552 [Oligella sp. MSHR50489EDL]|uniref:DUF3540 domain-containing protein n=1 Tax=Oligella sp. MSHR50489EDL TaxID=3139409 RepID=UPI003D816BB4
MKAKKEFQTQSVSDPVPESIGLIQSQEFSKTLGELEQLLKTQQRSVLVSEPIHALGEIIEVFNGESEIERSYLVKVDGVKYLCEKAASCLLMPGQGDSVLVSGSDAEQLYIIAIIKQAEPKQSELQVNGRLNIRAEAFSVQANQALNLKSSQLDIKADTAQCVIERADYVGKELRSTISMTRIVGKVYELIVDRLSQMSRSSFKITEQAEQLRAGIIDYQAEDSARIHSKYTMVTAKELVKVDSDQIHMG